MLESDCHEKNLKLNCKHTYSLEVLLILDHIEKPVS